MNRGLSVWPAPDILPVAAWLARCWQTWLYSTNSTKPEQLLSATHERAVWEGIIAKSEAGRELIQFAATAEAALDAYALMHAWHVPLDSRDWQDSRDTETFRVWAEEFRLQCDRQNWLPAARLPHFVATKIANGEIPAPVHIQLSGFAEFTPVQETLFVALKQRGTTVEIDAAAVQSGNQTVFRVGFVGTLQEIRTAAHWSRKQIESAARSGAPEPSIGIVVPELSAYRSTIERLFAEELHPGGRLSSDRDARRAFNISLGPPLSDYPLIQAALLILRMNLSAVIAFDDVTRLLRSPFIAAANTEATAQALLDVRLRNLREPEISLSEISAHAPSGLKAALEQWQSRFARITSKQLPSGWAVKFSELLSAIGWPGDRPLNSAEYQTIDAWNKLIREFAELDSAAGELSRPAAVSLLQRFAAERQFQPESEHSPVQILGVFEALGMTFDHLWVIGMHDGAWPRSASPNPFLPLRLQRTGNLPQSSPQRELEFAKRLSKELLASSPDIILSFPRKDGDADLRSSPLFTDFPESDSDALGLTASTGYAELLLASKNIESITDDTAPPWLGAKAIGGTKIFEHQAACPFRAFAKVRLGADALESAQPGLSPADRGTLIHDVFQRIWNELGSHATLIEVEQPFLNAVVHDEVKASIGDMAMKRRALQHSRFAAIEQARLERLVHEWLNLEKQRLPFMVIDHERKRQVTVGGIDLTIRVDRVDKLADGRHVLVDYKTSVHRPTEWDGPRPDDPQLPLYAITADGPLGGLAFGIAKLGETKFAGLTERDGVLPGVKAGAGPQALSSRVPDWGLVLENLARDFRNGLAAVDPKNANQTCRYCGLQGLCRISEANWSSDESEAEVTSD